MVNTMLYPDTRNRLLSLCLLSGAVSFCFLISFIVAGYLEACILYMIISIGYYFLYRLFFRNEFWTIISACLFYLLHTSYELGAGLDMSSLHKNGLSNSTNINHPSSLYLIFPDIIAFTYPILRYTFTLIFFYEILLKKR